MTEMTNSWDKNGPMIYVRDSDGHLVKSLPYSHECPHCGEYRDQDNDCFLDSKMTKCWKRTAPNIVKLHVGYLYIGTCTVCGQPTSLVDDLPICCTCWESSHGYVGE